MKVWVKDLDGDRTEEALLMERGEVASELRSLWFWDTPEEDRDLVFGWLDALQEALNRNEPTDALESCLLIKIEPAECDEEVKS
jgi:hypothetical protein